MNTEMARKCFYKPDQFNNDRLFLSVIEDVLKPDSHVLDAGAGAGDAFPYDLKEVVNEMVGVDLNPRVKSNPRLHRSIESDLHQYGATTVILMLSLAGMFSNMWRIHRHSSPRYIESSSRAACYYSWRPTNGTMWVSQQDSSHTLFITGIIDYGDAKMKIRFRHHTNWTAHLTSNGNWAGGHSEGVSAQRVLPKLSDDLLADLSARRNLWADSKFQQHI